MKKRYSFLTWILCTVAAVVSLSAQEKGESIVIGSIVKFQSKIPGQERRIFVSLPDGYTDSRERDPVLYCLTLEDGLEMHYASGGADRFLEHLGKEVGPFIDAEYRTMDLRIFWGHSIVGALGIYGFLKTPGLFHAYVLSSPYFIYDGDGQYLLKNMESFLKKRTSQKNFLNLTVGNEPELKPSIESFVAKLEAMKPAGVEWRYSVKQNENHRSVMAVILTEGLRSVFSDWKGRPSR